MSHLYDNSDLPVTLSNQNQFTALEMKPSVRLRKLNRKRKGKKDPGMQVDPIKKPSLPIFFAQAPEIVLIVYIHKRKRKDSDSTQDSNYQRYRSEKQ